MLPGHIENTSRFIQRYFEDATKSPQHSFINAVIDISKKLLRVHQNVAK